MIMSTRAGMKIFLLLLIRFFVIATMSPASSP